MQKRTSLMVAYDILQIAKGVSTVTVLVYQGNLNFKVVKRWLAKLIAKGLLEFYDGPTKTWKTTEKGLRFMDAMERVLWFWEDENIMSEDGEYVCDGFLNRRFDKITIDIQTLQDSGEKTQ